MKHEINNLRAIMSLKVAIKDIEQVANSIKHECELNTHVNAIKVIANQMIDIINTSV